MKHSAEWLIEHGCELTTPSVGLFLAVFKASHGDPCNGCNCKDTCPAWREINSHPATPQTRQDNRQRCPQCRSLLNPAKVARRGGRCACGATV